MTLSSLLGKYKVLVCLHHRNDIAASNSCQQCKYIQNIESSEGKNVLTVASSSYVLQNNRQYLIKGLVHCKDFNNICIARATAQGEVFFWGLFVYFLLYLVGVAGLEYVTRHLGLRVVRLAPQQISKIFEVIAVVDEARDELRFVFKNKHWGVGAAGRDATDKGGIEDQVNFPRLHQGAAVALLAPPADLSHQPR